MFVSVVLNDANLALQKKNEDLTRRLVTFAHQSNTTDLLARDQTQISVAKHNWHNQFIHYLALLMP